MVRPAESARRPFQLNEALPSEQPSRNEALPSFYFSGSAGRFPARSASFLGCPRRPAVFPKAALPLKSFRAYPTGPVDFQTEALPFYAIFQPETLPPETANEIRPKRSPTGPISEALPLLRRPTHQLSFQTEALPSFLTSPLEALPSEQSSRSEALQCDPAGLGIGKRCLPNNLLRAKRFNMARRPGGGEGRSASTLKALAIDFSLGPGQALPPLLLYLPARPKRFGAAGRQAPARAIFNRSASPGNAVRAGAENPFAETEALPLLHWPTHLLSFQTEALSSFLTSPLEALPPEQPSQNEALQYSPAGAKAEALRP